LYCTSLHDNQKIATYFGDCLQIWVPTNPRGAERLPPGIVNAQSDFFLRRLWGLPDEVSINKLIKRLSYECVRVSYFYNKG